LVGCATSTIQTRKQERVAAYGALSPEFRSAVDKGEIRTGMNMDAVYIAWGKPSQVFAGESSAGPTTTWLYFGTQMAEYRYWAYYRNLYGPYYYGAPLLAYDFYPRSYVRAEVQFENGLVKSWRSLQPPR
jgi:hypothetical protein